MTEREPIPVSVKQTEWGRRYTIGGADPGSSALPASDSADIIARFEHDQAIFFGSQRPLPTPKEIYVNNKKKMKRPGGR